MDNNNDNRYKKIEKERQSRDKANKHIDFVVIAYGILFLYLMTIIYISYTKQDINFVYAEPGTLYNQGEFTGILLKDEIIKTSTQSGPIKYFVPEGSKVRQNSYVCAVNQDPETEVLIEEQINSHLSKLNDVVEMTADDYEIMQDKIRDYALDKHSNSTQLVYPTKDLLQGTILDISQTVHVSDQQLFNQLQAQIAVHQENREANGTYYKMPIAGVVGYTFDGFEDYNVENYDFDILNQDVIINDASDSNDVDEGDPLFKVINNHKFYILVEVDPSANKYLQNKYDNGKKYNTIYFPRKNLEVTAKIYDLEFDNDKYYVIFEIDRYFDEFFTDRFVDFIIKYDDYSGIKIPNESVVSKDLIQVPKSAIFEEKGNFKIQKQIYSDEDVTHTEIVPVIVKVYYRDDDYAYIQSMDEAEKLVKGDTVIYTSNVDTRISSTDEYIIESPISVEGVYVINRGYSDFKRIKTIYEDETFRIIDSGINYSIGIYDKIVSDASEVTEFTTIN